MRSSRTIRLIVTCTDRKTVRPPEHRMMRNLDAPVESRAAIWTDLLDIGPSDNSPALSAHDLYCGEHWTVVSSLVPEAVGRTLDLWVASAGLGLIHASAVVQSYGATFSARVADSITRDVAADERRSYCRSWWTILCRRSGSIADLARSDPKSPLIFAGSPAYVDPLASDLTEAAQELDDPASLFVITSGGYSIPGSTTLRAVDRLASPDGLGGSLISLNARLAKWLVESATDHSFDPSKVHTRFEELIASCPDRKRFDRQRVDVDDVKQFIRSKFELAAQDHRRPSSASALLREFRDTGRACEQKKFGAIYTEVACETGGTQ